MFIIYKRSALVVDHPSFKYMEFVTIATTSNTTNFGDLTNSMRVNPAGTFKFYSWNICWWWTTNPTLSDNIRFQLSQQQEMHKILVILLSVEEAYGG